MAEQNSSAEITSKIRSAIKAKLTELGAYVDEELPDYIMVMIANKKSKQQMAEDLNLFLGKNSGTFTDWLQNVLDRLQSISRGSTVAQTVSQSVAASASTKESSKTSGKISNSTASKDRSRKMSPERKKKSPPRRHRDERKRTSSAHRKRRDSRKGRHSSSDNENSTSDSEVERRRKRSEKREDRKEELVIKKADKTPVTPPRPEKEVLKPTVIRKSTTAEEIRAAAKPMEDDVLVVRAEVEEGDELADIAVRQPAPKDKKSTTVVIRQETTSQRTVTLDNSKPVRQATPPPLATSSMRKPIEAPSPDAGGHGHRHVGTVRPMKRRTPSPNEGPSRKRRSTIGQVVQRPNLDDPGDLDEEYDPLRPQLGLGTSTATVASTVHVTERKYTVPREMQPKPSIFLRALNEANRSVKLGSRRGNDEREETSATVGQRSRTSRNEEDSGRGAAGSRSVFDRIVRETVATANEEATSGTKTVGETSLPISRRVQLRQQPQPTDVKSQKSKPTNADDLLIIDSAAPNNASNADGQKNTRFVVTMSGVDRKFIERVASKEDDEKKAAKHIVEPVKEDDDMDTLIVDVDEDELMEEEAMIAYSTSAKTAAAYGGPSPAMQTVKPIQISLDDDEDDEEVTIQPGDMVVVNADTASGSNESVAGSPRVVDEVLLAGMGQLTSGTPESLTSGGKIMERCRYWPNCQLGASCQYHHPTMNCKNFPQCRFGDKCLYIHPPCKYGVYCKNPNCQFAHVRSAAPGYEPVSFGIPPHFQQPGQNALIPCKFGGRCFNPTCPYRHPRAPCMYGPNCTKPNCTYSHRSSAVVSPLIAPTPRPAVAQRPIGGPKVEAAKFRWVAPQNAGIPVVATAVGVVKAVKSMEAVGESG